MRSSDIFLVSVVTSTRWSASVRPWISATRSSIWPFVGLTMTSGSMRPVGRTTCSTTCVDISSSYGLGVADRNTHLVDPLDELLEPQRPVVHRRRQPEAVLDQRLLARTVALELAVQLRDRLTCDSSSDAEPVVGEVVEQRVGRLVPLPAVEVHRVVLDARAAADLAQHLEVVGGAHAQALRLEQLAFALELGEPLDQLGLDALDRLLEPLLVGDVVRRGEQRERVELLDDLAGERVDRRRCARPRRRTARSAPPAPRTPGTPRWCRRARGTCCGRSAKSLRSYCSSTSRRRIERWSRSSPTFSISSCFAYISGEPRP